MFIVLFVFALVKLAGATQRLAGCMTFFGATTLMTVSLIEITFYISGMFAFPEMMPVISIKLIYAVQRLFFWSLRRSFLAARHRPPDSRILPRIFGYLAVILAIGFGAAGVAFMLTVRLPDGVTAAGSVQPIWWLASAITLHVAKERGPARGINGNLRVVAALGDRKRVIVK